MEFPHVARWSHAMADVFGAITSTGFLDEGITLGYSHYIPDEDGVPGQLSMAPGEDYFRMVFFYTYPPENQGLQDLWILRRTDKEETTKLDNFIYSPTLRRVRRQPQPRRDAQFPNNVQTFDDVVGRDAWEFSWRLLGTDVLHKTIRFPNTRPTVTLATPDGSFNKVPSDQIKMLGDTYPHYTADGGVACYVVEATRKEDWLPHYRTSRLIYWLDQRSFYPLRIEQYDNDNQLRVIEVRNAYLANPALEERGYAGLFTVYYDLALDLMSYSAHGRPLGEGVVPGRPRDDVRARLHASQLAQVSAQIPISGIFSGEILSPPALVSREIPTRPERCHLRRAGAALPFARRSRTSGLRHLLSAH